MTASPNDPAADPASEKKKALLQLFADEEAERLAFQRAFIVILALAITGLFVWMVRDFLGGVFLAGVLTIFFLPIQRSLQKRLGGRPRAAAALTLVLAILLILLPLALVLILVVEQTVDVSQSIAPWVRQQVEFLQEEGTGALPGWVPFRAEILPYQEQITSQVAEVASNLGTITVNALARASGSTLTLSLNIIVFLFALFYFLISGPQITRRGLHLVPLPQKDRDLLADRTLSTIRATVKGTLVIGIIQGTVTGVSLAIAGVPGAAFWGMVAGVLSIIPGIGTPLIWAPAGLWLLAAGDIVPGAALLVFGAIVIMNIDNLLRPYLVGRDAKMTDLMVLVSTLGGLTMFGFMGIIIGPVIAALMSSIWYLYSRSYAPLLSEAPVMVGAERAKAAEAAKARADRGP